MLNVRVMQTLVGYEDGDNEKRAKCEDAHH
jgi:hypothetical protein